MKSLSEIERAARHARERINELTGLTQRFDQALVRAEDERNLHLAKIADEESHLAELIDAAALIVQHLGTAVPAEATHTEEELAAVMAKDVEAVVAMADSPQDDEATEAEITEGEATEYAFQTIGEIAAEVTAAVAELAGETPATEDATDEPEMTDEQVERTEERLAAEPVRELEMADAGAAPRRFNPFAGNPFA